jgi:hypothetical protein
MGRVGFQAEGSGHGLTAVLRGMPTADFFGKGVCLA